MPAFSVAGVQPAPKPVSLQAYIKAHPQIEVEYRYSNHAKPKLADGAVAQKVKLPANSPIVIRLIDTVNGDDLGQGATVNFSVVGDVKVGNTVVIKSGSRAQAQVAITDDSALVGQAGKITISDFGVIAVDGSFIPLQGTMSSTGKDKMVLSVALTIFICPLFLLMKGGEATFPAGMEKTTYTSTEAEIQITHQ
jgi:hypothetical protein